MHAQKLTAVTTFCGVLVLYLLLVSLLFTYACLPCCPQMCGRKLSKVICLSSIGANRVGNMPFTLRNIGGDLDTKRAVEQAVIRGSQVMWYCFR